MNLFNWEVVFKLVCFCIKVKSVIFNVDSNIQENDFLVFVLDIRTLSSLLGIIGVSKATFLTVNFMTFKYRWGISNEDLLSKLRYVVSVKHQILKI